MDCLSPHESTEHFINSLWVQAATDDTRTIHVEGFEQIGHAFVGIKSWQQASYLRRMIPQNQTIKFDGGFLSAKDMIIPVVPHKAVAEVSKIENL